MQESGGCVRAPTTNWGVRNPGLMQDHNGVGTRNDNNEVQNSLPRRHNPPNDLRGYGRHR